MVVDSPPPPPSLCLFKASYFVFFHSLSCFLADSRYWHRRRGSERRRRWRGIFTRWGILILTISSWSTLSGGGLDAKQQLNPLIRIIYLAIDGIIIRCDYAAIEETKINLFRIIIPCRQSGGGGGGTTCNIPSSLCPWMIKGEVEEE